VNSSVELEDRLRRVPAAVIYLALTQVTTAAGAIRMFNAERNGHKRLPVLRAVDRRVAELGGNIPVSVWIKLVAAGDSVDANHPKKKNCERRWNYSYSC